MADAKSLTPPSHGWSATLLRKKSVEPYSLKGPENVKKDNTISMYGEPFRAATRHNEQLLRSLNYLKGDPLEIQNQKFENRRLGLIVCS